MYNNPKGQKPAFRQRLYTFMQGRNGPDKLYTFIMGLCIIVVFINLFLDSLILTLLYIALFCYAIFRVMSRNLYKRRTENQKYLNIRNKFVNFFKLRITMWKERKTHIYKKCPSCKKRLRLPRRKGEHTVKCPCCGERFDIKVK